MAMAKPIKGLPINPENEEPKKVIFRGPSVYTEIGSFMRIREKYGASKAAYDKAYELRQDDVKMLLGRSRVNVDTLHSRRAFQDANEALKLEPHNMTALHVQALALNSICEFEQAICKNYSGLRYRTKPSYFRAGVNEGKQILEDCIGQNAGNVLADFLPIIKKRLDLQPSIVDQHAPENIGHKSRIPKAKTGKKMTPSETRRYRTLSRVLAFKYLGTLANDKFFLESLSKNASLRSANSKGSEQIQNYVNQALKTLCQRQEMLRSQEPYYALKFNENSASKYQERFKAKLLRSERKTGARTVDYYFKQLEECLKNSDMQGLVSKAERLQVFLDGKSEHTLPHIQMYTDRLYRILGDMYLSLHRLSYTHSDRANRRRISFIMGLSAKRPKSYDSVINKYPRRYSTVQAHKEKTMAALEVCDNATMRCYLQHEMASLLNAEKNFSLAKFYAKQCQREAEKISNVSWWLNGCFAILSGDMQQSNLTEITNLINEAQKWIQKLPESERMVTFLKKCWEVARDLCHARTDEAKKREKQILETLDPSLKSDTALLFKRMSSMPAGRRMAVAPGLTPTGPAHTLRPPVRIKPKQTHISIIPGPPIRVFLPKPTKVAGKPVFD